MGSVRKSLFINDNNQDVLAWFEGVKSPSEAVCRLIREESAKEREIELLKHIIHEQSQRIQLLESMIQGTNITITQPDNQPNKRSEEREEVEKPQEEDHSVGSDDALSIMGVFGE